MVASGRMLPSRPPFQPIRTLRSCPRVAPTDSATEVGEFDVGEDEAQGDIGAEEQVNVLE